VYLAYAISLINRMIVVQLEYNKKGLLMKALSKYSVLGIMLTLTGCASAPKVEWVTDKQTDEFTDVTTCRATTGSFYSTSGIYTKVGALYPMVEQVDGELRVGLQSGGKYKIPVGNIQLRIDSNKAWDINTSETPIDLLSTINPLVAIPMDNLPEDQKKMIEQSVESSKKMTAQAMAPYTVATGDKAKAILKEMLAGKELKYRTVGLVQASSTVGEFKLDESLGKALTACNISY
jgi:hypothetical protein